MKICFILGPFRPGKCGISDYVDLLGKELERRGHSILRESIHNSKSFDNLSNDLPDADFYSIQFAPYSFAKRGLSGKSLFKFARSIRQKKVQINFHEIWIGAYPQASWKEKIIGSCQKREILKFLKIAQPKIIHASNSAAINHFKKEGIKAEPLYLFGNIPFHSSDNQPDEIPMLQVVFFGTLYKQFPFRLLGQRLSEISLALGKGVNLWVIGRQRESVGLSKLKEMAIANNFKTNVRGELCTDSISNEFQMCSLAISTTPYDILGKSGATAAMLEHGLPIYAYDDGDTPKENLFIFEPFQDQIFLINESSHAGKIVQFSQRPRKPFFDGVVHTADTMLEMLS